jgi:CheY-like chemotaxis protein
VSRILVADDNSNIQKMVALALKDEGIDVVAVGNGDAAMRRIPELRPDLVLADVFMPVRNGYELCEFIKTDSRYMSTPVVLLVGAFDPLDEQETQRVRADGVLKKPFVPPDPLINMVKALLAKSNGQKPTQASIPPNAEQAQAHTSAPATAAPAVSTLPTQAAGPVPQHEAPAVKVPAQQIEVKVPDVGDSDQVLTASRDPNLGDPFWAAPAETNDTEEAEEQSEDDPKDMVDMHSFGKEELTVEPERESMFRPESPILEGLDSAGDLGKTIVSQKPAGNPGRLAASQPSAKGSDESATGQASERQPSATPDIALEPPEASAEIFKFDPTLTFAAANSETPGGDNAERLSVPELTNTKADSPSIDKTPQGHEDPAPLELELPSLPNRDAVISAATEAARLAFSELNTLPGSGAPEAAEKHPAESAQKEPVSAYAPAAPVESAPNPEMVEAVVNRLLEQMQPQIMEVVNREVLRPAIEAIVRREIKKS